MSGVANVGGRHGIKYPDTVMASLRSWLPGDVAPSVKTTAIIDHGGRIGVTLVGIDPRQEVKVSKLVSQMREGQITDLNRAPNAVISLRSHDSDGNAATRRWSYATSCAASGQQGFREVSF